MATCIYQFIDQRWVKTQDCPGDLICPPPPPPPRASAQGTMQTGEVNDDYQERFRTALGDSSFAFAQRDFIEMECQTPGQALLVYSGSREAKFRVTSWTDGMPDLELVS